MRARKNLTEQLHMMRKNEAALAKESVCIQENKEQWEKARSNKDFFSK